MINLFAAFIVWLFGIFMVLVMAYGWLINITNLVQANPGSMFDYPFAVLGVFAVPLGSLVGYFGW